MQDIRRMIACLQSIKVHTGGYVFFHEILHTGFA